MVRSYKCTTEITIHSVSAPGTWLPNRDDVYLTIELFNQVKRTRLTDPIFPLTFHDRFSFEKIFWTASDPLEVSEILEDLPVVIELRQVTDVYLGGALLAYFDSNAKDFLSPYPTTIPRLEKGRELIMCRTVDFTGISPKLEFTTYTVIENYGNTFLRSIDDSYLGEPVRSTTPKRSASRQSRSRTPVNGGYGRQTVSSALRSYSPLPMERTVGKDNFVMPSTEPRGTKKRISSAVELRPPFVVRKVDPTMLLRKPKLHDNFKGLILSAHKKKQKRRCRSASPSRSLGNNDLSEHVINSRLSCEVCNLTNDSDLALRDICNVPPEPPRLKISRDTTTQKPIYEISRKKTVDLSDDSDDQIEEDREVATINYRPSSPIVYYPSLRSRYSPIMNSTSERITQRVHGAQMLNRSPLIY